MFFFDLLPVRRRNTDVRRTGADLANLTSLQQEMNRMFEDFFRGFGLAPFREMEERLTRFAPSIDVSETSKEIKVTAELPGMDEKDISVTLEDDFLILSGEKKEEKKEEKEEYYHREMSYGSFRRVIPLTSRVETDKIKATFKKGVLVITMPKVPGAETGKGKKIEIKAQ